MNGKPQKLKTIPQDRFEKAVAMEMAKGVIKIQQPACQKKPRDSNNTREWLMEKETVLPMLHSRVISRAEKVIDLTEHVSESGLLGQHEAFAMMASKGMTRRMGGIVSHNMVYLRGNDEGSLCAVTVWVVADLQTKAGRTLASAVIQRLNNSIDMRLGFVPNGATVSRGRVDISRAVHVAIEALPNSLAKSLVTELISEDNAEFLQSGEINLGDIKVNGMDMSHKTTYLQAYNEHTDSFLKIHRLFAEAMLDFRQGERGLVANGQVLGPFGDGEELLTEDIELLELYVNQHSAKKVKAVMEGLDFKGNIGSDVVMKISGLLSEVQSGSVLVKSERLGRSLQIGRRHSGQATIFAV